MLAPAALLATAVAASPTPPPSAEELSGAFVRFCLETKADRVAFDAEVARSTDLRKTSGPLFPSALEFHRRWKIGAIELSFTDAPPPTPRSCAVTASARGGFDGQAIALQVAKASATVLQQSGDSRWIGMTGDGQQLLVNNRPNPDGYGDVEIILQP